MSEFASTLATEETFEWRGATYKLAGLVTEAVGQFERWFKDRARRDLAASRGLYTPAEYEEHCRLLSLSIASGDYDFFSPAGLRAQASWEGRIFLAWARVALHHADFTLAQMREVFERDVDKLMEIQRKMDEVDTDPNGSAPAGATAPPGTSAAGASSPSAPSSPASPGATAPGKSPA